MLPKLEVPLDSIVQATAELVLERLALHQTNTCSPYMTVAEACEYLRCKPQRIHNLCSERRLTRYKDGSRLLLSRGEIEGIPIPALRPA